MANGDSGGMACSFLGFSEGLGPRWRARRGFKDNGAAAISVRATTVVGFASQLGGMWATIEAIHQNANAIGREQSVTWGMAGLHSKEVQCPTPPLMVTLFGAEEIVRATGSTWVWGMCG
jgi:hypothetical protein